eukprot:comp15509_c0_seq1/m.12524 comp15509_c0_seq1/g.12524  ORF comp15509_c0_seq1/g.12524 comp15509_c0_seq1/m.12524 type:complete len:382 (-) comp15509_c0_seq1:228-1373(-)
MCAVRTFMGCALLLCTAYSGTVSGACDPSVCSYGEMADERVWKSLVDVRTAIRPFLDTGSLSKVKPGDTALASFLEVTAIARDTVDLYAYAYSRARVHGEDRLWLLHHDIMRLEKAVGVVVHVDSYPYARHNITTLRMDVRREMEAMSAMLQDSVWREYLSHPSRHRLRARERHSLAQSLWEPVPTFLPSAEFAALGNIAAVIAYTLAWVNETWAQVCEWDGPTLRNHTHDFPPLDRRIATMDRIQRLYGSVWANGSIAEAELSNLRSVGSQVASVRRLLGVAETQGAKKTMALDRAVDRWLELRGVQAALPEEERLQSALSRLNNTLCVLHPVPGTRPDLSVWQWAVIGVGLMVVMPGMLLLGLYYLRRTMARRVGYQQL